MQTHQLTSPELVTRFLFAGDARFTLVSPRTGTRFTYRVKRVPDGKEAWFVSVLSGPDNESSYSYAGMLNPLLQFRPTRGSKISIDAPSVKAIVWFAAKLAVNIVAAEFWHEGRCGRCGRTLTVPESIESGFGPECAKMSEAIDDLSF